MSSYFHMSKKKLKVGTKLCARGGPRVDPTVEGIIEGRRKPQQIKRSDAIFVAETKDVSRLGLPFDHGYLLTVEPDGRIERRDANWIGELQRRHKPPRGVKPDPGLKQLTDETIADKYLAGKMSPSPAPEVLCDSATVVDVVDELSAVRRPKLADTLKEVQASRSYS